MKQLLRYCTVGVINTAVGYAIFWVCLHLFGCTPGVSNAIGYGLSLCLSFVLNRRFVFAFGGSAKAAAARFALAFLLAFGINQLVLMGLIWAGLRAEFAQIGAMAAYTILFFLLSKFFVFRPGATATAARPS